MTIETIVMIVFIAAFYIITFILSIKNNGLGDGIAIWGLLLGLPLFIVLFSIFWN